jgi:hypothetical protein
MNISKSLYQQILSALDHYGPVTAVRHLRDPDIIVAMQVLNTKKPLGVKEITSLQDLHLVTGFQYAFEHRRAGILITFYFNNT